MLLSSKLLANAWSTVNCSILHLVRETSDIQQAPQGPPPLTASCLVRWSICNECGNLWKFRKSTTPSCVIILSHIHFTRYSSTRSGKGIPIQPFDDISVEKFLPLELVLINNIGFCLRHSIFGGNNDAYYGFEAHSSFSFDVHTSLGDI